MGEYRGHVYVNTNSTPYGVIAYRDSTGLHTINAGGGGGGGVTDHGALTGLSDDDHSQYLNATRAGTWHGTLSGAHVTNGDSHDHLGGDGAQIDHGSLAGLSDDDHSQYQKTSEKNATSGYAGLNSTTQLNGDHLPAMSTTKKGGVPATGTPSNKFLRDDASWQTSPGTDSDAIHDNVANEISAITEKTTPANDDLLIIEDSDASYVKKKVKMSNLPGGGGGLTTALASQYGRSIQGALFTYLDSSYNLKLIRTRQSLLWPGPRDKRDGNVTFGTIKSAVGFAGQIVRDADGDLHTCYVDSNGYACHAISDDNGESWTENVAENGIWVDAVYLGIGHDGTLHMVYGGYSSQYRLRYRSSSNKGTSWSSYATLDSDASNNFTSYPVSIIVRTNGNIHVLYCNQVDMREAVYTTSWASGNIHTGAGSIQYASGPAVYDAVNDVIISSHTEYDYTSGTLTAVLIMKRIAGASWTSPLEIGDGVPLSMVVDRLGDAHLLVSDVDWDSGYDATLYYHKYDHNTATWMTEFELDDTDGTNYYVPYYGVISVGHDDVLHVVLKKIKAGATSYSNYYLRKPPGAEWDMMDEMQVPLVSTDTPMYSVCDMAPYVADEMCQDDALIWDEEQEAWINRPIQNRPDKDLIQVENGSISSDVALTTANTFYDGPSVDLGPGYWMVTAHATYYRNATTAAHITARITDKTNHYASQQQYHESLSGITRAFSMQCLVYVTEKTTIYLQMTSSAGGASGVMRASTPNNSSGNNATQITAVKYRGLPA